LISNNKIKSHLLVLLATILVAASFIASQKLSGVIDSISLTLFRFFISLLCLAPIILLNKEYRNKVISTLPRAMIISLFYSLYFIGLFKALETTTALNTGTLFTLVPLITAFLCIFVFKDKITIYQMFLYIIGIVGTCIVVFKGDLNLFLNISLSKGDIIFILATISMSLYSISTKFFHKKGDILLVLVFSTLLGGSIWMYLTLEILNIPLEWYKIEGDLIYYMAYLVVGATLFTIYLYQQGAINLGPKKLMAYVYLNPAFIAVLLFIFENQLISLKVLFGIIISSIITLLLLL
jgi:drug/metabolite transporter (DMT)-like permease